MGVAGFELDALLTYHVGVTSPLGVVAIAFYLGPGLVGVLDLAWLAFTRLPHTTAQVLGALSWIAMIVLCPLSLFVGSVMAVVRAVIAIHEFVTGRRLQRTADAFLSQ